MSSPPCTENVYWFVLAESVKLSKAQVMHAWCHFAEVPPLDFPVDESTPPTLTSRDTWLLCLGAAPRLCCRGRSHGRCGGDEQTGIRDPRSHC